MALKFASHTQTKSYLLNFPEPRAALDIDESFLSFLSSTNDLANFNPKKGRLKT